MFKIHNSGTISLFFYVKLLAITTYYGSFIKNLFDLYELVILYDQKLPYKV